MIEIHFEDHGQDLLWLIVDEDTHEVVVAGPLLHRVFQGVYIFQPLNLKKGDTIFFSDTLITDPNQPLEEFKYKADQVKKI